MNEILIYFCYKDNFEEKNYNFLNDKWGLGIGDWGLGIGPNPQSPIPNPQSPIPIYIYSIFKNKKILLF